MFRTFILIIALTIGALVLPQNTSSQVDAIHTPQQTVIVADKKKNE